MLVRKLGHFTVRKLNSCISSQKPIPTNNPKLEPKRPPRPVNISSLVKLSPTVANTIHVTWAADFTRAYVLSVFMVRKLTSAELLQRLKNKGTKNPDYTRSLSEYRERGRRRRGVPVTYSTSVRPQSRRSCRRTTTARSPRRRCACRSCARWARCAWRARAGPPTARTCSASTRRCSCR